MTLSQKLQTVFEYFMITVGSIIAALGVAPFLIEANVVPGGVTGISMAINFVWDMFTVGQWILILNVPLFIWGVIELGNAFGIRTLYGFGSNAIFIDMFRGELPGGLGWALQDTEVIQYLIKNDFFFFMVLGTILIGVGLGIIFKFKATTAGTEIICAILKKRFGIKPGVSMLAVDFVIIACATVVLYLRPQGDIPVLVLAMYAVASLYVQSKILDHVVYGFDYAKSMMIMSSKNEEISNYIMNKLDRGVTALYARGLYTNKDREVLMTIVSPNDARNLAPHIKKLDPNAFIILSNVHEVLGEGFRSREEVDIKFFKNVRKREADAAAAKAAQNAIRAELVAKQADEDAAKAREFANNFGTLHHVETAHEDAQNAEKAAQAAHDEAQKAREHAIELEVVASSIEDCVMLDEDKGDKR